MGRSRSLDDTSTGSGSSHPIRGLIASQQRGRSNVCSKPPQWHRPTDVVAPGRWPHRRRPPRPGGLVRLGEPARRTCTALTAGVKTEGDTGWHAGTRSTTWSWPRAPCSASRPDPATPGILVADGQTDLQGYSPDGKDVSYYVDLLRGRRAKSRPRSRAKSPPRSLPRSRPRSPAKSLPRSRARSPSRRAFRGAVRGAERRAVRGAQRGAFRGAERGAFRGAERGAHRGADRGADGRGRPRDRNPGRHPPADRHDRDQPGHADRIQPPDRHAGHGRGPLRDPASDAGHGDHEARQAPGLTTSGAAGATIDHGTMTGLSGPVIVCPP